MNGGGPLDDDAAIDDGMMDGIESHQMNVWVGVHCRYVKDVRPQNIRSIYSSFHSPQLKP